MRQNTVAIGEVIVATYDVALAQSRDPRIAAELTACVLDRLLARQRGRRLEGWLERRLATRTAPHVT